MIEKHRGDIGHHVGGHPARDLHGLERLPVAAAVDLGLPAAECRHRRQQRCQPVDGIDAHPGTGRMGPFAL